jgi:hypothetical protein
MLEVPYDLNTLFSKYQDTKQATEGDRCCCVSCLPLDDERVYCRRWNHDVRWWQAKQMSVIVARQAAAHSDQGHKGYGS